MTASATVRFMSNTWHISKTAVAGAADKSTYARMIWTSKAFAAQHPEYTSCACYKAFCDMLGGG